MKIVEELIHKRPKEKEIIQKICDGIFRDNENYDSENDEEADIIDVDDDSYYDSDNEIDEDEDKNINGKNVKIEYDHKREKEDEKNRERKLVLNTLKAKSPFTVHFAQIQEEVSKSSEKFKEQEATNVFFCPEVIEHLFRQYMPYCFLWASFTLKNLSEDDITRFTNGTLEKKFGTRKSRSKNHLKLNPPQYAIDSEDYASGLATQFLAHGTMRVDENNNLTSDNDSNFEFEDADVYQDANMAEEGWNKKEKKEGVYQQKRAVQFKTWMQQEKLTKTKNNSKVKRLDLDINNNNNNSQKSNPKFISILKTKNKSGECLLMMNF
jgi:hypothetical protein